jgi:conjugation system TraG family ATPase
MEKIDVRGCFPVMNGGDGVILSKRGDVCYGWEVVLPPAFRCNEQRYDAIVQALFSAVTLLPDYAIVHKQDVYMKKKYVAEKSDGLLQEAYERHFDGREYLDHRCRLFLIFSSKKNVRGASSGLLGITAGGSMPKSEVLARLAAVAEQFATVVQGCGLLEMRQLTEEDIFGAGDFPGLIQDYLNFTDEGDDVLSDIQMRRDKVRTGDRYFGCHLIADLDQLPAEVTSCRKVVSLSTDSSAVNLSFMNEIGQELDCEHIVNHFILKEPQKDIHGELDTRRRQMLSMAGRSAENRMYSEELNEFLESAASVQMHTVRFHINVLAGGTADEYETVKDKVVSAISRMGVTPVYDIYDAPCQFWASIPGNEAGLAYQEYMTADLKAALCMGIYDGFEPGVPDGVMKMSDRLRQVPQRFDIQETALEMGLIENYNVFLLGPSGSGKSFFMNKYLKSCYDAGQHVFLIDVGDSYRALCNIIKEESKGVDGTYYTFDKGKPISFNPFRNVRRFRTADNQALNFLFTLMLTLWKNDNEAMNSASMKIVRDSIIAFIDRWSEDRDPVFNDYYRYVRDEFCLSLGEKEIGKEYFDLKDYLISLEQFYDGGVYDYLLNSNENADILNDRFVVFEIDRIKGDPVIYPVTTLVIMDAFMEKMSSNSDFKVMCIEEAWKAIMGTQMASYMMELWKTARKHRTSAVVVTQELKDIVSSPIIKDTILENSAVKILLDQTRYMNRFDALADYMSLDEDDKAMVLSLNRYRKGVAAGREVYFNLGNRKSFVMRLEVSSEERIAFSSQKRDKVRLAKEVAKTGSYVKAIRNLTKKGGTV